MYFSVITKNSNWDIFTKILVTFKREDRYDGPGGPLFSSMVSCEVFSESDIVLGSVKGFSEVLNSSRKSQAVLGTLIQFSKVSNSSPNF